MVTIASLDKILLRVPVSECNFFVEILLRLPVSEWKLEALVGILAK